jgi:hypothetical protein
VTNAEVQTLIELAAGLGRTVDAYDASTYLGAKEILSTDPENSDAVETVNWFNRFLKTGEIKPCMAQFRLPLAYTAEEIAEAAQERSRYREIYRRLALVGIAEGDYYAGVAFRKRYGLTEADIFAMSDQQLLAFR